MAKRSIRKTAKSNRSILFTNQVGRKLLSVLLVWNVEREKRSTHNYAEDALEYLSRDLLELIGKYLILHIIITF